MTADSANSHPAIVSSFRVPHIQSWMGIKSPRMNAEGHRASAINGEAACSILVNNSIY